MQVTHQLGLRYAALMCEGIYQLRMCHFYRLSGQALIIVEVNTVSEYMNIRHRCQCAAVQQLNRVLYQM